MRAEIVSIGTELLLGEIVDTNASYLAQQFTGLGIDLYWVSVVGDNRARIVEVLKRAWGRSDLVVITGGLGPTDDDLTRESIADLMGEEMVVDPISEQTLRQFFEGRGVSMPERNIKQASLIPSSQPLLNPVGTAPGWLVERDGKTLVAMPGVPSEMYRMWEHQVVPRLQSRQGSSTLLTRTLKVIGMGESAVEESIKDLVSSANPTVATYAKQDGVHVRIAAKAGSREDCRLLIDSVESTVRTILGAHIYGTDDETLVGSVGRLLLDRGCTLALAEVSTGGWLSNMFTGERRTERFFRGGVVVPSLEMLPFPIASLASLAEDERASGEAIADGLRAHFGADIGLVTMPVQSSDGAENHLFISFSDRGDRQSHRMSMRRMVHQKEGPEFKRLTSLSALSFLRRHLF